MTRTFRRFAVIAALVAVLPLVVPGIASAQMREFSGKVDRISDKKMIVDNRMGDKVAFDRVDDTTVEGLKTSWGDLDKDDWVTVSWKFIDKPRKAYKVVVTPPREEEGEEVE